MRLSRAGVQFTCITPKGDAVAPVRVWGIARERDGVRADPKGDRGSREGVRIEMRSCAEPWRHWIEKALRVELAFLGWLGFVWRTVSRLSRFSVHPVITEESSIQSESLYSC